jgi:hypothetical protein
VPLAKGERVATCPNCEGRVGRIYERDNTGTMQPYHDLYRCSKHGIVHVQRGRVIVSREVLDDLTTPHGA